MTVASRLAVDRLRSHERSRREYVTEPPLTPEDRVALDDSVRMALLVVLEPLTPAERTAFILHDVFDLEFDRIADILGETPATSRQHASRARRRVREDGGRFVADPAAARALSESFGRACADGDLGALVGVLTADVHGNRAKLRHLQGRSASAMSEVLRSLGS